MKTPPRKRIYIPRDFIDCLRDYAEGFDGESAPNQWGLAQMVWEGSQKRRRHRTEAGAMTFSQQELDEHFGRNKYSSLAKRVSLFSRSAGWSRDEGVTRAYRYTAQAKKALQAYHALGATAPVDLLQLKGDRIHVVKTLPSAISSTDTRGKTVPTSDWDFAKETLKRVPVNTEMLEALRNWLRAQEDDPDVPGSLKPYLRTYADTVFKLQRLANTTTAGPGQISQVYAISPSGRLYARGVNLQNSPSLIKDAALHGLWEYDFANCHFSIICQMAAKHGVSCSAIEHYMANKKAVRKEIASGAGITIDQAKQCLLALLYGARTTAWRGGAIPSTIGVDAAESLYALPMFKQFIDEVDRARRAIVDGWPRTANGSLTNASGRAISKSARDTRKLAHLVQGVEADALRTLVKLHAADIVLLQHDGFVSLRQLDLRTLENAVFDEVGCRLQLEEAQLELHADPRALTDRTKDEIDREALPVLDLDAYSAD